MLLARPVHGRVGPDPLEPRLALEQHVRQLRGEPTRDQGVDTQSSVRPLRRQLPAELVEARLA